MMETIQHAFVMPIYEYWPWYMLPDYEEPWPWVVAVYHGYCREFVEDLYRFIMREIYYSPNPKVDKDPWELEYYELPLNMIVQGKIPKVFFKKPLERGLFEFSILDMILNPARRRFQELKEERRHLAKIDYNNEAVLRKLSPILNPSRQDLQRLREWIRRKGTDYSDEAVLKELIGEEYEYRNDPRRYYWLQCWWDKYDFLKQLEEEVKDFVGREAQIRSVVE